MAILVSLCGAIPILASDRKPNLRESWTILIAAAKVIIVASLLPTVLKGGGFIFTIAEVIPNVPIQLRIDAMGMFFALVASILWFFTSLYSIGYMRALDEHGQTRYFASFAVAISATIGVAFSANLLTLYLFYEVLSLSTYPLVTHHQDAEAKKSGRKYLTYILGTSIGFALPAMLLTYQLAGTLVFTHGGILAGSGASPATLGLILVLFLFVIMLLNLRGDSFGPANPGLFRLKLVGMAAALGALALLAAGLTGVNFMGPAPEGFGGFRAVGILLYTDFIVPLETAGLLLLAAIVGAVVLAKPGADE